MEEVSDDPTFIVLGPLGGNKDALRLPQPKFRWEVKWTPQVSESTVRRFIEEAKYFLLIHNVVVQHFVDCLPALKYMETDKRKERKKRDNLNTVIYNAKALDEILNPGATAADTCHLLEDDDDPETDLEVEKSFHSLRELIASASSSFDESEIVSDVSSVRELLKTRPKSGPSLFSKVKDRFTKLVEDERTKLRQRLQETLPDFAQKKLKTLDKLVAKTCDYTDLITKLEEEMLTVEWPVPSTRKARFGDYRSWHDEETHHIIFAPRHLITSIETIFTAAYILFEKTNDLEMRMKILDEKKFAKLQEAKEKIPRPSGNDLFLDLS